MVASIEIVQKWANLPHLPADALDFKTLWAASGNQQAANWDAGSLYLAAALKPYERPGQNINQAFIQGLDPCTVGNLGAILGW